jgi:putative ABC transport system permease protein
MYFKVDNHKAVFEKMYKVLDDKGLTTSPLFDYAAMSESEKALITVINIFSYGFIVLISLIAAANVFNTISTNIALRRREFAMLKSIGMTQKMFNRMMNYECLLYGIKGLAYGIPVSIGVTWLIYKSILFGLETGFFIPWYSLVIAVGSVFAVVFATMIYSMQKIKKDNPIDALKDENL